MPYYVCPYCGHEGAIDESCCGERGHMQFRLTDDERLFFYKVARRVEAQSSGWVFICNVINNEMSEVDPSISSDVACQHYKTFLEYAELACPGITTAGSRAWLTDLAIRWEYPAGNAFRAIWLQLMAAGARPDQIQVALSRYKSILHALSKEEDE